MCIRIALLVGCLLMACGAQADDVLLEHFDVFVNGEVIDGRSYNTYRVPNIARANDGTLIAVAEARFSGAADPGGTHIDLVYKRSSDRGLTWSAGRILDRHPDAVLDSNGVPTNRTSASNSVTFVNRTTGRVWNFNLRLPHATPSAASRPGVEDMQTWARYSDDSGATWSKPTHIAGNTTEIPYEDFYPNLGSATQLSTGRLVLTATEDNATVASRSFVLYSDDAGETWKAGEQIDAGTNEAQVIEISDGRLLMTARQNGGGSRKFAISSDQGATWNPSYDAFPSTPVMEAVERYTQQGVDEETVDRLLHTIPVGGPVTARTNLDLMIATDESQPGGPTFGNNRRVVRAWAGYSDLVSIDRDEIGVFWERGDSGHHQKITYTRLNRTFLEPAPLKLGLIAYEGFDYDAGRTLGNVDTIAAGGEDYGGGHAAGSFTSAKNLDLLFALNMDSGDGGTVSIDSGLTWDDQASNLFGQVFETGAQAGAVTQITVQRAPNGSAGAPVFLHIYDDTDVTDGVDVDSFLGASLAAANLNPTNLGTTTWAFDGTSIVLNPSTQYYFAFANSATAGDTTTSRAALNVAPTTSGYALGGNGFNSAWHDEATDLTDGTGAFDADLVEGSLAYDGFRLSTVGNHVRIGSGGTLARGIGVAIDLDSNNTTYASLLISRSADKESDDTTDEALAIELLDASGASHIRFGVDDDEAFFVDGLGGVVKTSADALNPVSSYFLVMKIVARDTSDDGNFDQVFLKAFESGEAVPDLDNDLNWTLVGNTKENKTALLDRLLISSGSSAVWSLDELRIGGDFHTVTSSVSVP